MNTIKIAIKGNNVRKIVDSISNYIASDIEYYTFEPVQNVYVITSEKYYFRNNSHLMSCLIIKLEDDNNCIIDIVAGGGGTGIMGLDYRAERSRVREILKHIENKCINNGWQLYNN